jgi:hypothetical protein
MLAPAWPLLHDGSKKMYTGHKRPNKRTHIIGPCDTVKPIGIAQYSPTNTDTNIWGRSSSQTPNALAMTETPWSRITVTSSSHERYADQLRNRVVVRGGRRYSSRPPPLFLLQKQASGQIFKDYVKGLNSIFILYHLDTVCIVNCLAAINVHLFIYLFINFSPPYICFMMLAMQAISRKH